MLFGGFLLRKTNQKAFLWGSWYQHLIILGISRWFFIFSKAQTLFKLLLGGAEGVILFLQRADDFHPPRHIESQLERVKHERELWPRALESQNMSVFSSVFQQFSPMSSRSPAVSSSFDCFPAFPHPVCPFSGR